MWRALIGSRLRGGRAPALAIALALLAAAAPRAGAHAVVNQDPTPPAVFLIEQITVEGARHASPDLIVAESLLREGQSYTETALRQGVYRVRRLPFVRAARFSLRKGSERGSYELVITVEETHRVFFGAEAVLGKGDEWGMNSVGTVGLRAFVGAHGVAFAAVQGGQVRAGYTHYNLLNRHVFASLEVNHTDDCCGGLTYDHVFGGPDFDFAPPDSDGLALTLGFPVARNQTVQLQLAASRTDTFGLSIMIGDQGETVQRFPVEQRNHEAELRWVYDTTDDPVVPSRGTVLTAALSAAERESDGRFLVTGVESPFQRSSRVESESVSGTVSARHHWPLSSGQSLSLEAGLSGSRFRSANEVCCDPLPRHRSQEVTSEASALALGYSANLWSEEQTRRLGDLRFEGSVRPGLFWRGGSEDVTFVADLEAGVLFRNAWGIFRFRVFYQLVEG